MMNSIKLIKLIMNNYVSDSTGFEVYQYQNAACTGTGTPIYHDPYVECQASWGFYYYVDSSYVQAKATSQCVGKVPPGQPTPPKTVPKNPPSKTGSKNSPSKSAPKSFRAA